MTLTASKLLPESAVFRHVIPAGEPYLHEVKAGQTLRLLDLEGNQAVDTLFYSATHPRERYDPQRTLRRQRSAYLTTGTVLYSNLGRPMLTIVADTCGRHDTLGGACAQESNTVRYSPVTPEGGLTFEDGISAPGKYVELRAQMDVIVLISNCPQLNNPCNGWNPTPAELLVWD